MNAFKIPLVKEIMEKRKHRVKKLKVGDTTAIDHAIRGTIVAQGSTESSLKMMTSQKKAREEEGDNIVLWIPHSASSYYDSSVLESVELSLVLPKDEHHLSAIGLVQAADWEVTMSFQVFTSTLC